MEGRNSVVGIATHYELDGPGIEFRCEARFSAPVQNVPVAIQPPAQWVPRILPEGKAAGAWH